MCKIWRRNRNIEQTYRYCKQSNSMQRNLLILVICKHACHSQNNSPVSRICFALNNSTSSRPNLGLDDVELLSAKQIRLTPKAPFIHSNSHIFREQATSKHVTCTTILCALQAVRIRLSTLCHFATRRAGSQASRLPGSLR